MLCIGFSGGLNLVHESPYDEEFGHDGAAVLLANGEIVAAIEEERLNRIKHSDKFPAHSLRFCLESRSLQPKDVDCFAFYATEAYCNTLLARVLQGREDLAGTIDAKTLAHQRLQQTLGSEIDKQRITFVRHHMAHAASAFALSGFKRSLVVAIDGNGDFLSGLIAVGEGSTLEEIESFPQSESLGELYVRVIHFLGYGPFDEYKVMGLAPYGNPAVYRPVMRGLYELLANGGYHLYLDRITSSFAHTIAIRKKGEPFTQQHKDLAAALQEALEEIVMHVLRHRQQTTGLKNLCLAGGVAHNCTMNGRILYSRLFEQVFVQPAAHDAGCALGAALIASQAAGFSPERKRISHVYWGTDIGRTAEISQELQRWNGFVGFERSKDVAHHAASLIAEGHVVGWVQGRSEFGPRALGNRSILADPRPAENKERINLMVKKREGYRPFAPSVLEEKANSLFDLPPGVESLPFMIFVVKVREDKRALLGATTHIDGTARVHTVSRSTNPRYWDLIQAFNELTGVPVLLNTSFNNNVEPIVNSLEDAIVSFLTTGLDYLIVDDFIVRKHSPTWSDWLSMEVSLPSYTLLYQDEVLDKKRQAAVHCEIRTTYDKKVQVTCSQTLFRLLIDIETEMSIAKLLQAGGINAEADQRELVNELRELWSKRLVVLRPQVSTAEQPTDRQSSLVGSDGRSVLATAAPQA